MVLLWKWVIGYKKNDWVIWNLHKIKEKKSCLFLHGNFSQVGIEGFEFSSLNCWNFVRLCYMEYLINAYKEIIAWKLKKIF
jgi:hypothetical protein